MTCLCSAMQIFIIGDPLLWEQELELFICKLPWNISAMRHFVCVNFDEQSISCLRKFWDEYIKRIVLDYVSNLMVNCCCIRGGDLGVSSDLDLNC